MAPAKKNQQQKMSLGDFLTDETLGSWADEMEDMPLASGERTGYGSGRAFGSSSGGFGSGFNDRGYSMREQLPLPDKPPYTAHIGNLSFDVTEGDVTDYFTGCSVTNVRIVEDKLERKPKGFGYVEFANVDGLKKALDFNGSQMNGRAIRVSVAEPPKDRPDAREFGDWTRKGPLPDLPGQRRTSDRTFGSPRNFDNASDAGSDRTDRNERRRQPFEQDNKVRDFGNWERRGPLPPSAPPSQEGGRLGSGEVPHDRKQSPAWGEGRSQDGSRPPRKEFQERPVVERAPTAAETDNQWRNKMRPDPPAKSQTPSRDTSVPSSPLAAPAAPVAPITRPKLNLQKRTVSETDPAPSPSLPATESKASPFGGARPIDTFAKEKEIEEKRQLALRAKKEQEEKVREEKRIAKEAAKAEKAAAAAASQSLKDDQKENGAENSTPGKKFEILSKESSEGVNESETGTVADTKPENGAVTDDKAVKPKEVVRSTPARPAQNNWRSESVREKTEAKPESTTESLDADGWSTVSKPQKNRRGGGNQASRAIAS